MEGLENEELGQLKNCGIYAINFIDFCRYDHLEYSDVQCTLVIHGCILTYMSFAQCI